MQEAVDGLVDEVRLLWHALSRAGERLHADEPITLGMRGVLELLILRGAATVPQMAARRHVSRQHIQTQVNLLVEQGLVALADNPRHRRSVVVRLTPQGKAAYKRMKRREQKFFAGLDLPDTPAGLERAAATLAGIRRAITGES